METNIPALIQELFTPLRTLPILICYKCEYAVRLSQIITHLTSATHKIPTRIALKIQEALPTLWPQLLATFSSDLILNQPLYFDLLPLYQDGILCRRSQSCSYVCRTRKGIKQHWRDVHNWHASTKPSDQLSTSSTSLPTPEQEIQVYTRSVYCQRLYRQGPNSHYFAVTNPVRSESEEPESASSTIDHLFDQLEQQHQQIFQPSTRTVETVEIDEATPWLRRTRWTQYLAGQLPEALYALIEPPVPDPLDPLWAIHQAMDSMARTSQQIAKRCGHLIRVEVVRTETNQAPQQPLQTYIDSKAIIHHLRP